MIMLEENLLTSILATALFLTIAMLLLLIVNLRTFPRLRMEDAKQDKAPANPSSEQKPPSLPSLPSLPSSPFLSILVPARNEERNIKACVRSLVAQSYENLEVLVLDDHSTDATATIIQCILDQLPPTQKHRLRLLSGAPLPPGWIGKNFACYQLAKSAQGEYLLFTDADTIHAPDTARAALSCIQSYSVQLLTAQPEHLLGSLGERLIIPLLNFTLLTLLPIALIPQRPEPSLSLGNGQFLCFHRPAYDAIGGHVAVKGYILEDVQLARNIKKAGYSMVFVDALQYVSCRMYRSFGEVWAGFSKNLFALYNYSLPFALLTLLFSLALFVLPPLLLLLTPLLSLSPIVLLLATSVSILTFLIRILLTLRFVRAQRPLMLLLCLLHPLSILLECLILLNSIRWRYRKNGTTWKGRHYS